MGPRVPFALLPLGIYLSNKVFKTKQNIFVSANQPVRLNLQTSPCVLSRTNVQNGLALQHLFKDFFAKYDCKRNKESPKIATKKIPKWLRGLNDSLKYL